MSHDEIVFEELFKYYPTVLIFIARLGFSAEDARDLAQDVFLRVYEHMHEYPGEARWRYIQQTARNLALNKVRDLHAQKRDVSVTVSLDAVEDRPDDAHSIDFNLERSELYEAIDKLESSERDVVRLLLDNASYKEIAVKLGITVATVKKRVVVARKQLAEIVVSQELGRLTPVVEPELTMTQETVQSLSQEVSSREQLLQRLAAQVSDIEDRHNDLVKQIDVYGNMLAEHVRRIDRDVSDFLTRLEN
jgi:RNA polymerase sigma-70 factor (ECF subfamily)